jgi:aldehyde:ferredoxin oxidoreductase
MTLNDDVESIIKCNDICNKYGLDTISVGATVAWAMECYENGLLTENDTDGIALNWGNPENVVKMTQAIADQTGFGKILALGSAAASEKLGKGSEYLQTVRGIELPMHDPRFSPGYARTYQYDPTPARHVKGGFGMPEMSSPKEAKYDYEGKGKKDMAMTCATEVVNAAGLCLFGTFTMPRDAAPRFIAAATGWDFTGEEVIQAGMRIMNMKYAFNLREGQEPADNVLPPRCVGEPAQTEGPLEGVTVDHKALAEQFFESMGWDKETMIPTRESLEKLGGLDDVIQDLYG